MKKIYIFIIVAVASVTFVLQPADGSRSFSAAPHFSAPAYHSSAPSRSFSSGPVRFNAPARFSGRFQNRGYLNTAPRFSSTVRFRNPTYVSSLRSFAGDRTTAFNSRRFAPGTARLTSANRTVNSRAQTFDRGRVIARYSANWNRNWDRGRDHFWHGHRCHFRNGFWFIYDPFLYPYGYGYGYYPYGSYYDGGYYDDSYASDEYAPSAYTDQSQDETGSRVSDVQSALSREGYYDGPIDGRLGAGTRKALRRYQRDHGLDVTGGINRAVIEALQLR
jgi:hypothetical protein